LKKCKVCGRKAEYTIFNEYNQEESYCELHFMEKLKEIPEWQITGCERCER